MNTKHLMQSGLLAMHAMFLLLIAPNLAMATNDPDSFSAEDVTPGSVLIYMSHEQEKVRKIAPRGGDMMMAVPVGNEIWFLYMPSVEEDPELMPDGEMTMASVHFKDINKSMQDGVFIRSIYQIIESEFREKTWLGNVETSSLAMKVTVSPVKLFKHSFDAKGIRI